jgi:hypothetical protein
MRTFPVLAVLLLIGCSDPYLAARQTIVVGRNVTAVTGAAFETAKDTKEQECLKIAPVTDPRYIACMKDMANAYGIWQKVDRIAGASWNEAEAIVTAAEQKKKGLPVDWLTPLKQGVCVVAESLSFLPESVKKHIEGILALIKTFTCGTAPAK